MHTMIPVIEEATGNLVEYNVVHVNTPEFVIASFEPNDTDSAAHLVNRLNGGFSSEMAALVKHLRPILEGAVAEMKKDRHGGR